MAQDVEHGQVLGIKSVTLLFQPIEKGSEVLFLVSEGVCRGAFDAVVAEVVFQGFT
jgi:hypothetical protein